MLLRSKKMQMRFHFSWINSTQGFKRSNCQNPFSTFCTCDKKLTNHSYLNIDRILFNCFKTYSIYIFNSPRSWIKKTIMTLPSAVWCCIGGNSWQITVVNFKSWVQRLANMKTNTTNINKMLYLYKFHIIYNGYKSCYTKLHIRERHKNHTHGWRFVAVWY